MNKTIDFTQDSTYDIVVNKNRTLNATLHCIYVEDGVEHDFNFQEYQVALMHVKTRPESQNVVLALSTINSTIQFLPDGRIKFEAEPNVMDIRAGQYVYDLYLYNQEMTKRQFMSGKFTVQSTVTN